MALKEAYTGQALGDVTDPDSVSKVSSILHTSFDEGRQTATRARVKGRSSGRDHEWMAPIILLGQVEP
jgi:hypothetical protein